MDSDSHGLRLILFLTYFVGRRKGAEPRKATSIKSFRGSEIDQDPYKAMHREKSLKSQRKPSTKKGYEGIHQENSNDGSEDIYYENVQIKSRK